ncbi:hypothetical protein LCGC14_0372610 [marine sediment metagenome]|uniref:Uncharacterized protein n=1 Tax=marine sediment metagenome TaxID=412755 RepID=A0A0F9T4W0_9ZZZZ
MSNFIGRGEIRSLDIFNRLFYGISNRQQVNIKEIILAEDYEVLDQEIKNHNFDLVLYPHSKSLGKNTVIEINYKHKEKIAAKLRRVIIPLVVKAGYQYLEVNDWDCRERGLFWLNSKKEHIVTWDDYRDIIDALETAGIIPDSIE